MALVTDSTMRCVTDASAPAVDPRAAPARVGRTTCSDGAVRAMKIQRLISGAKCIHFCGNDKFFS
jgi:hypothetical protein